MNRLIIDQVLSEGRYGKVYKGSYSNEKVFTSLFHFARVFTFCLIKFYFQMHQTMGTNSDHHSSVFTIDEHTIARFIIVTQYQSLGTLSAYLRSNTLTWELLCRMASSIASGVSYLHAEIKNKCPYKPVLVHRDINPQNILIKNDLSCCISDFGFSMLITSSSSSSTADVNHSSNNSSSNKASLTDVGTLRYMSPEVLDGAVNLFDCKMSLTQVDVYAMGLVLWEMASRCADLYKDELNIPAYKMAFEEELGRRVTFENMQIFVSKNKRRPTFNKLWKADSRAIKLLKETIEECWDQDADARISALCVDRRFSDLSFSAPHVLDSSASTTSTDLNISTAPHNHKMLKMNRTSVSYGTDTRSGSDRSSSIAHDATFHGKRYQCFNASTSSSTQGYSSSLSRTSSTVEVKERGSDIVLNNLNSDSHVSCSNAVSNSNVDSFEEGYHANYHHHRRHNHHQNYLPPHRHPPPLPPQSLQVEPLLMQQRRVDVNCNGTCAGHDNDVCDSGTPMVVCGGDHLLKDVTSLHHHHHQHQQHHHHHRSRCRNPFMSNLALWFSSSKRNKSKNASTNNDDGDYENEEDDDGNATNDNHERRNCKLCKVTDVDYAAVDVGHGGVVVRAGKA
ncbi:hypothetical protein HELRODRAFT_107474 [Helobdella robusta]|uniref:receptor protein serine/threonine kinase n=1 Tax=Helobdella robusta TaxID=6412 RepID=T1EEA7_HELRO|nr:hypothetical protein HELRODRAFT_107474 [Helobdella robusta]ESN96309.1 hypothetical protein HELRODRAFT_107474 [Helobdella robusta]